MKKKKRNLAFTLIELLAVIIILGILVLIAVPAVISFITDSRKSSYINTARNIAKGAIPLANSEKYDFKDEDTTYYIDGSCIKTDNGFKSPYGEFTAAYVGIIFNGNNFNYYWISTDETGHGVKKIIPINKLDEDDIKESVSTEQINDYIEGKGIGLRKNIKILDCNDSEEWREIELDNLLNNITEDGIDTNIVCVPAKKLHTVTCDSHPSGCKLTVGRYNTITYGTIPNGTPKAGDAYDCKLDFNGDYTERFYYLGSEGENSSLIYYKNMNGDETHSYDTIRENYHGPRNAYLYLPTTSEWNNPRIIAPGIRQIVSETGTTYTNQTIELFTYTDRAARLLTAEELVNACPGLTAIGNETNGELDSCSFFLENVTGYEKYRNSSDIEGYCLETPYRNNKMYVWRIAGTYRKVKYSLVEADDIYSVRPVITVKTEDIEQ